jgi:hypothetical protein
MVRFCLKFPIKSPQKGSASLLFAVFVIPALLVVGSVIVDVETYTQRRQLLQTLVDEAAVFGAKYLPNQNLAKSAANNFLAQKVSSVTSVVSTSADAIQVRVSEDYFPIIASYFKNLRSSNSILSIPVVAYASSRITPIDLYIAFDRGIGTAPVLLSSVNDRFGTPAEFPIPYHFNSNQFFTGNTQIAPEIALEQCYNPVIISLKQMAVRAIDLVKGVSTNRIALSFFPGATNIVGQNARLSDVIVPKRPVTLLDWHLESDNGNSIWVPEPESNTNFPIDSEDCLQVLQDTFSADIYHYPNAPIFNNGNSSELNLNDVVWSRVASQQGYFDSSVMLADLSQQLFAGGMYEERRSLVNSTQQIALVFSSGAPKVAGQSLQVAGDAVWNALSVELEKIKTFKQTIKTPLKLYYFIYNGSTASVDLLQALFNEHSLVLDNNRQIFSATAINVDSVDQIISQTLPYIIRGGQRAVIQE